MWWNFPKNAYYGIEVERIIMDFVVGFPKTLMKCDYIWIIADRLINFAHFILIRMNYNTTMLAKIYEKKIVRLHVGTYFYYFR